MTPDSKQALHQKLTAFAESIRADSVVYWSYQENENTLAARCCPSLPSMEGFQQPLESGLISQTLITGLPILEHRIKDHQLHDPAFDEHSGKNCRSLMAAPVAHDGELRGVLSAATFDQQDGRADLSKSDLAALTTTAQALFTKS